LEIQLLRSCAERDRNRLDVPREISLGRHLQRRAEATNADARLSVCRQRALLRWLNQPTLATRRREDWRRPRRHEERSEQSRELHLPNHAFSFLHRLHRLITSAKNMAIRWTHITITVSNIERSIAFYTSFCKLSVLRDRRREGGGTVWLGPA